MRIIKRWRNKWTLWYFKNEWRIWLNRWKAELGTCQFLRVTASFELMTFSVTKTIWMTDVLNSFVAAERSQMKVVICACDSSQIFAVHASSHNSRSQITWVRTRRVCDEVSRVSPPVGGHLGSPAAQPRSARGICHRSRSCRGLYSRETDSSPYSLWRWAVPSLCRFWASLSAETWWEQTRRIIGWHDLKNLHNRY